MRGVNIGEFDRQITIQQAVEGSATEFNVGEISWQNFATNVHCRVREPNGAEQYQSDRQTSVQTLIFRIRYRTDLNRKMRIVYNGENYQIVGINEPANFRRQVLDLRAELTVEE